MVRLSAIVKAGRLKHCEFVNASGAGLLHKTDAGGVRLLRCVFQLLGRPLGGHDRHCPNTVTSCSQTRATRVTAPPWPTGLSSIAS